MTDYVSRREFLTLLGVSGGTAAAILAGTALGLLPGGAAAATLDLQMAGTEQRRIAILGGGLSGLTVAYELSKRGYDCTILEASHRCGGRIFTVRNGDLIDEIGNRQYCDFDDEPHMYFNAGAARIPSTHRNILAYCKKLNVELEIFVNENKTSYVQDKSMLGGQRIRNIEYTTHMKGFMAELMAKALDQEDLNAPFSESEAETLLGMIRSFGDLSEDDLYRGSLRAGYATGGFLEHGVQKEIIAFRDLLKTPLGRVLISANEGDTGPMLLQPKGGMDKIVEGFLAQVGDKVKYRAMVASVKVGENGVDITYDQDGVRHPLQADYCFNCIPTHLITGINNNFPAEYVSALKYVRRGEAYKAAFQAKRRFWEEEDIYGGISWMNTPSLQIWYPSHGIHQDKGVVLGAYDYGGGMYHTRMTQQQRIEAHLSDGEKLHPGYGQLVEKPITVAWHRMNHMLGCSARWRRSFSRGWSYEEETHYKTLQQPVNGRHYLIGDQMTMHSAWQESAILSAYWAMADFNQRIPVTQA
ncbi:MAG: FAD-dependent oxidoreductase [Gammaproteobacteria bacterium]|nr:FAD-dependent oxidoreductase [Gammaproteobacteria bacterium]